MNILIIGSGAREHAMALKVAQSSLTDKLFMVPGNPGTSKIAENINIAINDFYSVSDFCLKNNVEMIIPGPEGVLAKGIFDFFNSNKSLSHIKVIGPSEKGALLESSKDFAKKFMIRHNIPTAKYNTFSIENIEEAFKFLETLKSPFVLKADGLAAGKGVLIIDDLQEAKISLHQMLSGKFGDAGNKVVIEEFLSGIEMSVFVLSDGKNYVILPNAKDYKRIGEGDEGLNTGGMGAVSPVPFADNTFMSKIENQIIIPTIKGLSEENIEYIGFIFIGIMNVGGNPYVIEYNVRMGDPETEVVFPRINSDVVQLFADTAKGNLKNSKIDISEKTAVTIMLVSEGYPEEYQTKKDIFISEEIKDSLIFHAGTTIENDKLLTNGGRVIAVTSFGENIQEALNISYKNIEKINFSGKYFRKDIGFDLM
jgi:phosphoribosylamine--glycine ligase